MDPFGHAGGVDAKWHLFGDTDCSNAGVEGIGDFGGGLVGHPSEWVFDVGPGAKVIAVRIKAESIMEMCLHCTELRRVLLKALANAVRGNARVVEAVFERVRGDRGRDRYGTNHGRWDCSVIGESQSVGVSFQKLDEIRYFVKGSFFPQPLSQCSVSTFTVRFFDRYCSFGLALRAKVSSDIRTFQTKVWIPNSSIPSAFTPRGQMIGRPSQRFPVTRPITNSASSPTPAIYFSLGS
jgi:hypothetical protein